MFLSLTDKNATLASKVRRIPLATTRLKLESCAVFLGIDEFRMLCDQKKGAVTQLTALKRFTLVLESELRQNRNSPTAAEIQEDEIKK